MSLSQYKLGNFKPSQKVTIYKKSEFSGAIIAIEMKLIEFGTKQYAQYNSAPFVAGIVKRKRSASMFTESFRPYLLIVNGWNQPKPAGLYEGGNVLQSDSDVVVTQAKYGSFDGGYERDFDNIIDKLIENDDIEVLADFRGHDSKSNY